MNETIRKFGYPQTLLHEFDHWLVLIRPQQVTLGSLVLAANSEATAFADLEAAAFSELSSVIAAIESALKSEFGAEKMNYLMLMMVDPHVHFHVIPRYSKAKALAGHTLADAGWPGLPDLGSALEAEAGLISALKAQLGRHFS
jgi:diadenosine tetraphosphate (Ap4A) HIT family hydrolase